MFLTNKQRSTTSTAVIILTETIEVGGKLNYFVNVRYSDKTNRPDLVGKMSGWLRIGKPPRTGDTVNVGFDRKPDRNGNDYYQPFIFFGGDK